jgi:hypothetical protein
MQNKAQQDMKQSRRKLRNKTKVLWTVTLLGNWENTKK